jgi:hypothetical protein
MKNESPHFNNDEVTQLHAMGRLREASLRGHLDRGEVAPQQGSHSFRACDGRAFEGSTLP